MKQHITHLPLGSADALWKLWMGWTGGVMGAQDGGDICICTNVHVVIQETNTTL